MKHQFRLGYADSFAAGLALASKATLVSADPSFEKIGKSLKWIRLPKFLYPQVVKTPLDRRKSEEEEKVGC